MKLKFLRIYAKYLGRNLVQINHYDYISIVVECPLGVRKAVSSIHSSPTKDLKNGINWILAKHSAFQGKGMGREAGDHWCVKVSLQVLHPWRQTAFPFSSRLTLYSEVQRLANIECRLRSDSWKTVLNARPWRTHFHNWEGVRFFIWSIKKKLNNTYSLICLDRMTRNTEQQ